MDSTSNMNMDAANSESSKRPGESIVPGLSRSSSSHGLQGELPAVSPCEFVSAEISLPSPVPRTSESTISAEEGDGVALVTPGDVDNTETDGDPLFFSDQRETSVHDSGLVRMPSEEVFVPGLVDAEEITVEVDPLDVRVSVGSDVVPETFDIGTTVAILDDISPDPLLCDGALDACLVTNTEETGNGDPLMAISVIGDSAPVGGDVSMEDEDIPLVQRNPKRRASSSPKDVEAD